MTEPQHPPCTVDYHQNGQGCGWMNCSCCGEEYNLGNKWSSPYWHFFPDAESAYWLHCQSEQHLSWLKQTSRTMSSLLAALEPAIKKGKAYQKQLADPAFKALRDMMR